MRLGTDVQYLPRRTLTFDLFKKRINHESIIHMKKNVVQARSFAEVWCKDWDTEGGR